MRVNLFNFQLMRPIAFEAASTWKQSEGSYQDVLEIREPSWQPEAYIPQTFASFAMLHRSLLNGVAPFVAVMRVLVTLAEREWPGRLCSAL